MITKTFVFFGFLCLSQASPLYSTIVCENTPNGGLGNLNPGMNRDSTPSIGVSYGILGPRGIANETPNLDINGGSIVDALNPLGLSLSGLIGMNGLAVESMPYIYPNSVSISNTPGHTSFRTDTPCGCGYEQSRNQGYLSSQGGYYPCPTKYLL